MLLPFFSVSVRKLAVMSTVTFGLYFAYWFYRQWIAVRNYHQINISPAARTAVSPFFGFGLAKRILDAAGFTSAAAIGLSTLLGSVMLISVLVAQLPPPYSLASYLITLPALFLQRWANQVNRAVDPMHQVNARFSRLNWLAIVPGSGMFLLVVVSLVLTMYPG